MRDFKIFKFQVHDVKKDVIKTNRKVYDTIYIYRYLPKETSFMVWDEALFALNTIADNLSDKTHSLFKT